MGSKIELGDIEVDVIYKDIKNIHLSVYPPSGSVRISAPLRMDLDTIRVFTLSRINWIRKQQKKLRDQERETPREFIDRESHYLWGKRYLLKVVEKEAAPLVRINHSEILLQIRPGTDIAKRREVMQEWYRKFLKDALSPLVGEWQERIGVKADRVIVQRMKTKWGSCNPKSGIIRLNLELAKKPPECLEYILVHELTHLLESTHNNRFIALLDQLLPKWQMYRDELNRLPVRHEEWSY